MTKLLKCSDKLFQSRNASQFTFTRKLWLPVTWKHCATRGWRCAMAKEGIAFIRLHRDAYPVLR